MKITITNNFTNRKTVVDSDRDLTPKKIRAIRRMLCVDDCTSGDVLGARGPQSDEYESLKYRADQIMLTGVGR